MVLVEPLRDEYLNGAGGREKGGETQQNSEVGDCCIIVER